MIEAPRSFRYPDGSVGSLEAAEITLPRAELERLWTPEYLERLARTYWRHLSRISLGLLRVSYGPASREVVLLRPPLVLLTFRAPEYDIGQSHGSVLWPIERGLLVAPRGRGKGFLRISVVRPRERREGSGAGEVTVRVSSEVVSFFPMIAGWGGFARVGQAIYRATQLRIHVIVTHAFLRSLARLELEPSVVGALARPPGERPDGTAATVEPASRSARR